MLCQFFKTKYKCHLLIRYLLNASNYPTEEPATYLVAPFCQKTDMWRIFALVLIAVSSSGVQGRNLGIIGGDNAERGEFPWIVSIRQVYATFSPIIS